VTEPTAPAEGWYPDPAGGSGLRWWTGVTWTDQTRASTPAPVTALPAPTAWSPVVPEPLDDPAHDVMPARRRSRTPWLVGGTVLVFLGVIAIAIAVALSLASRNKLDMGAVESEIAARISAESGLHTTVSCPGSVDIAVGTTFTCEAATDDGVRSTVTVHQDDDQGNLTFGLPR
jgi:hypothetical protein